jgi:hypothetical protein
VNGIRYPGEVVDVRDRVIRVHCASNDFSPNGRGIILEVQDKTNMSGFYTRLLTTAPDNRSELVLLRSASLQVDELRNFLRVPTEIRVRVEPASGATSFLAVFLNISAGGALIEFVEPGRLERSGKVTLRMLDEPSLRVDAEVVHIGNGEPGAPRIFGVRFINVDPRGALDLTWYVWNRVKKFFHDPS